MKTVSIRKIKSVCHKYGVWVSDWQKKLVCGAQNIKYPNHSCENRLNKVYIEEGHLWWKRLVKYEAKEIQLKEYPKLILQ